MYGLIPAPSVPAQRQAWRDQLARWRELTRDLLGYDDALYAAPEFQWIARTFTLAFVMLCDLAFYDGAYRLESFLEHGQREFGGYDALILWHAYPCIGFDARNQFDFYREMPGGLAGLRALVDQCHARGVRVYVDYNPWDVGTRREDKSDLDALVDLVTTLDADAVFLDTMSNAAQGLRQKLDAARPGVALESEALVPLEYLDTHPSSWAQGVADAPGVLRNKWFERRHMQHRVARWRRDHTAELHTAWMNGVGMVVWENVFGSWRGWSERDKALLRSMVGVQRRYADLLCGEGEGWTPLVPTLNPSIYASLWQDGATRLWTLVNESETPVSGALIAVPPSGDHYFDLIGGEAITPDEQGILRGTITPRGIGALLAAPDDTPDLRGFLRDQAALDARANDDSTASQTVKVLRPVTKTQPYAQPPPEMTAIPAWRGEMTVTFTVRECGFPGQIDPDLDYPSLHKPASLTQQVDLAAYALDRTPVTNRQFAQFLAASGYAPDQPENFLAHWRDGRIPDGLDDHPVVYVGLEDARAYARWAGKRLPTEAEWQFAAQGRAGLRYPWGDDWLPDRCNHGQFGGTTAVDQFPQGRSPFGCADLCGNVWEWTESERSDGRTRFVLLKGGSYFRALGSEWYADGGAQPSSFAATFLLMYPGLDRCATIGFRCAADL